MKSIQIVGMCVLCCVVYGILHDQITARICVEYFTIGHEPIFATEDPTLLGLGWGVVATWWVGVIVGAPLAAASRWGDAPKREPADLWAPLLTLFIVCFIMAVVAGALGYLAASAGLVQLVGRMRVAVPPEKHVGFITDLWAHSASYAGGVIGGIVLIVRVIRDRRRERAALGSDA